VGWYLSNELNVGKIRVQMRNTPKNMKNPKRISDLVIQRGKIKKEEKMKWQ